MRKPRAPRKSAGGGARKAGGAGAGEGGEEGDDGHDGTGAGPKGDLKVNDDNAIFSKSLGGYGLREHTTDGPPPRLDAVRSPDSSLQTTVDDWIQSYSDDKEQAIAELVNFLLRVSTMLRCSITSQRN